MQCRLVVTDGPGQAIGHISKGPAVPGIHAVARA